MDVIKEDTSNMPEPLGKPMPITTFIDADHVRNVVVRRLHSGKIICAYNTMITS